MNKRIKNFLTQLSRKDVTPEQIEESFNKNMWDIKDIIPNVVKREILGTLFSCNNNIFSIENIKKLSELNCMIKNCEEDSYFINASLYDNWKEVYDVLLNNNITPFKGELKGLSGFYEKLLYAGEYDKVRYLHAKGCEVKIRKFNNIVDSFIMSMNKEGISLMIELGLWNPVHNIGAFCHLDKKVSEDKVSDVIDYLNDENILDERGRRMVALSLFIHGGFSIDFIRKKYEILKPDFGVENFLLFNRHVGEGCDIYNELVKNEGEGLLLCEEYGLRVNNLSIFSLLKSALMHNCVEVKIREIYDRASGIIHKVDFADLISESFNRGKVNFGLFLTTQTESDVNYYYSYRNTVKDFSIRSESLNFIKGVDKYFPQYINERGVLTKKDKDLTATVLAFCFDIEKFNEYYGEGKITSNDKRWGRDNFMYAALESTINPLYGINKPLISYDEFVEHLIKSNFSLSDKKEIIAYLKNKVMDDSQFAMWEHFVLSGAEKRNIEEAVGGIEKGIKKKKRI